MSTTVELATPDGPVEIPCKVVGEHFAVHRRADDSKFQPWRVTHRPTGKRMPGEFWTEEHAESYAEALAALDGANWSSSAGPWPLGPDVMKLRSAAEVADMKAWCNSPLPEWPKSEEDVTADALVRYYAMTAQSACLRSSEAFAERVDRSDPDAYDKHLVATWTASAMFVNEWAVLRLLRALIQHAPDKADEVAVDLWSALEDGGAPGEWLWEWLVVDYRIDPDAIAEQRRQHQEKREQRRAAREAERKTEEESA